MPSDRDVLAAAVARVLITGSGRCAGLTGTITARIEVAVLSVGAA